MRRFRAKNPDKAAYYALKYNAKRRNKPFELTFEQFKEFCDTTGYVEGRGKNRDSLTIDRIDRHKGYTVDNIQIMSHFENSVKDCVPF